LAGVGHQWWDGKRSEGRRVIVLQLDASRGREEYQQRKKKRVPVVRETSQTAILRKKGQKKKTFIKPPQRKSK